MKTVILYATKYGSARKAAELLKEQLNGETVLADVGRDTIPPLDEFDAVILGGSVYIGQIQKQLAAYARAHTEMLLKKRLGLFLCAAATDSEMQKKEWEAAFPPELYRYAAAKDILGYRYDFTKMNFFEKMIIKKMTGCDKNISEFYEDKIARFAQAINE